MAFVSKLSERLSERMDELNLSAEDIAEKLKINQSTVRDWKRNKYLIFLDNLIKLADCLNCSIDFLVGRSETVLDFNPQICPPFYDRLREVMDERNISRYKLCKETGIEDTALSQWKKGSNPHILTLEKLATCLNVSIDYLVGRDR